MSHYQHPAQKYLALREKNLLFFQHNFPGIFQFLSTYQMQSAKLDILPESNEVDILDNKQHLYKGQAQVYAKREVATFLSAYDYGSKIHSIRPLEKDAYQNQRFFARSVGALQERYHQKARDFKGYQLGEFFPLMVFMGIGLGKHIDILTKIRDISHVIALETNMDHFSASLYSIDWQEIITPFLKDPTRSFQFILIPQQQTEERIYSLLWNSLIKYCPIFPVTTLFYNHMGNPVFDRISDRINQDLYVHLFSFGNLDDELNQLNNALHNFKNNIPILDIEKLTKQEVPICIVGSGPSLDQRIEDLKALADTAIIISSGTALRALWKHGIKPDFQVELESDFNSYLTQGQMEDKEFMQSIRLIGAAQLNPLMFTLFGEARLFFKKDGALGDWFGNENNIIENATPTCTNAALAIALRLKNSALFLFGLDYGFPDKESHHASGSVYYKDEIRKNYAINSQDLIEIPSASGSSILTTTFLYTAKRRVENILIGAGDIKIFNCSNGAHIENTTWLKPGAINNMQVQQTAQAKTAFINTLFSPGDAPLTEKHISASLEQLLTEIELLVAKFLNIIHSHPLNTIREFTDLCSRFFPILNQLEASDRGMFYFVRGSIWHFLLAGYTHVYSLPTEETEAYLDFWKNQLSDMLSMMTQRFEAITSNQLTLSQDPMVNHRLCEALMDELIWDYQHYSIIDGQIYWDSAEVK